MEKVRIAPFKIIGIRVRTTNENGQAAQDIPQLWNQFMTTDVMNRIPNKTDSEVLSIYTNYETDHTKPYDTILGCRVSTLEEIPEGLEGHTFEGGHYLEFAATGNLEEGAVYQAWVDIWGKELNRVYTADFEVYGEKALDRSNGEVPIYVAI